MSSSSFVLAVCVGAGALLFGYTIWSMNHINNFYADNIINLDGVLESINNETDCDNLESAKTKLLSNKLDRNPIEILLAIDDKIKELECQS